MKKFIALALFLGMAGSASALTNNGTGWMCNPNANGGGATTSFQYCTALITSGTTSTQLNKFTILPTKQITIVGGVSGSAVANVVTPTINLFLGNRLVASQNISVSTAGNVVNLGLNGVPFFDGITISQSQPSLISATNSLNIGVIEATRIQSIQ